MGQSAAQVSARLFNEVPGSAVEYQPERYFARHRIWLLVDPENATRAHYLFFPHEPEHSDPIHTRGECPLLILGDQRTTPELRSRHRLAAVIRGPNVGVSVNLSGAAGSEPEQIWNWIEKWHMCWEGHLIGDDATSRPVVFTKIAD